MSLNRSRRAEPAIGFDTSRMRRNHDCVSEDAVGDDCVYEPFKYGEVNGVLLYESKECQLGAVRAKQIT